MKKRRWTLSRRKEIATAYLFLLPFIITWVVWSVLPLIQSLNMSLYDFSFIHPEQTKFIGIGNYKKLFANGDFCGGSLDIRPRLWSTAYPCSRRREERYSLWSSRSL